ncbi:hypothetical protein Tco_0933738 [Tanacetum coccineum]
MFGHKTANSWNLLIYHQEELYIHKEEMAPMALSDSKKNEGMLCDQIVVLKSDASFNEAEIITLKKIIEKLKKEKEDNLLKINNYDNATKSLDKVIGSKLVDNHKKGLGYNVVPHPLTCLFAPPTIDLSHFGNEKFKEPEFVSYGVKGQFLRELRDNTFSGNDTEDLIEHIGRVLEIARTINTWNELKQAFIRRFGPPSVTIKRLGEIHNFRQEEGESLYHAWERYNDLLFKCPSHDLKDYQKVNTFYNGLGFHTRRSLDSRGLILGLTAAKALESIQEMADHVHINGNNEEDDNNQGITLKNKPSRNLKETFERYLEESCKRQDILDEWMKQFIEITNKNLKRHNSVIKNLEEKVVRLAHALAVRKVKRDTSIKSGIPTPDSSNPVKQDCVMKLEPPRETPIQKVETFTEKLCYKTSFHKKKKIHEALSYPASLAILRSIQSPKGIADNVLTYAYCPCYDRRFGGKISLEVGTEKIVFNANEGATASIVSPVCVINGYQEIDDFGRPEEVISLSPIGSPGTNRDSFGMFQDFDNNMSIGIDDFIEGIDDLWKDLDPGTFTNDVFDPPLKHELFSSNSKEKGFKVTSTRNHVVKLLLKDSSIGTIDARFGRGKQANEGSQGQLRHNYPAGVTS